MIHGTHYCAYMTPPILLCILSSQVGEELRRHLDALLADAKQVRMDGGSAFADVADEGDSSDSGLEDVVAAA